MLHSAKTDSAVSTPRQSSGEVEVFLPQKLSVV